MGLEEKFVEQSWILNANDFCSFLLENYFPFLTKSPFFFRSHIVGPNMFCTKSKAQSPIM